MLIDDVVLNDTLEKRDRNWMIRIYSELERLGDVGIECHREVVLVKNGEKWDTGGEHGERKYVINKKLSDIMMDTITLPPQAGGITLTAGQIALALEMLSDRYADVPITVFSISQITPSGCFSGSTGVVLTITGQSFVEAAVVQWDGTDLETTFVSSTELTALVPDALVADVVSSEITVMQDGEASNALTFSVTVET